MSKLIVSNFIEFLIDRATHARGYGIRGEKPIAMIAALKYVYDYKIVGKSLLELFTNYDHLDKIKIRFIDLAKDFSRLSDPNNSWSVITGSSREIQNAILGYANVNEAFSRLTQEEIKSLLENYTKRLLTNGKTRTHETLLYICSKCGKQYSPEEYKEDRFCRECNSIIFLRRENVANTIISEEDKERISQHIYNWYQNWRKSNSELEEKLLKEIDAKTPEGRFEIVMLATLFSEYAMKEERAYSLWLKIKSWFKANKYNYVDVLIGKNALGLSELEKELKRIRAPSRFLNNMKITSKNFKKINWDLNNLLVENNWYKTIDQIQRKCQGVYQKAFWITRIMKQKGAWDVPGEYCCVSDSHVKALLQKTGFISSIEDLFYNSKIIWKYFDQPFDVKYYDLSVFRFSRENGCKNCKNTTCELEKLIECSRT